MKHTWDAARTERSWRICIMSEKTATGIKTIRRTGTSLGITITDLADAIEAAEGDKVVVEIRRF